MIIFLHIDIGPAYDRFNNKNLTPPPRIFVNLIGKSSNGKNQNAKYLIFNQEANLT